MNHTKLIDQPFILLFIILTLLLGNLSGCSPKTSYTEYGYALNTVISITVYRKEDLMYAQNCITLASEYEKLWSKTIEGSDVWNINHSSGNPTVVCEETMYLLQESNRYFLASEGLIDITTEGLSSLWNISSQANTEEPTLPSSARILEQLEHVGFDLLSMDEHTITLLDPYTTIDLGFIAKGYIGDCLKEYLVQQGVTSAIINLGGNVVLIGSKAKGQPFEVAIQYPFKESGVAIETLEAIDMAVVTSGIYERSFQIDNQIYHHIIDPYTGYPVETDLLSATIVHPSSMTADALSTTCLALGREKATELLQDYADAYGILIGKDYSIYYIP